MPRYINWDDASDIRKEYIENMNILSECNPNGGSLKKTFYSYSYDAPRIKNVIFNDPATIVFWEDGSKTIVKCQNGDIFDPEKGLTMAIAKKVYGNKGNYCNEIKKWIEPYYEKFETENEDLDNLLEKIRKQCEDINARLSFDFKKNNDECQE